MKGSADRTKVVVRHLPPTISQATLMEQVDGRFAGRYNWVSFRSGKNSQKHQYHSRAYINFHRPEDVIEFAEFFDGHVFVNEKGTQFKATVEYAPSQRLSKQWSKKDGREGTISKDPEYLDFLEFLAKPVENLPSAEIQLERKEAERAGAVKDAPIVTPLMDFVRHKRAVKSGSRRSLSNGKLMKKAAGASSGTSGSASSRRSSGKKKMTTAMYVLRDTAKTKSGKDKSTYIMLPKRDDQRISNKSVTVPVASQTEVSEEESGTSGIGETEKKKVLLLKGKEREISHVSAGSQQSATSAVKDLLGSTSLKPNLRRESSGKLIRTILKNRDARQSPGIQSDQQIQSATLEDRRPPRPATVRAFLKDTNGAQEGKVGNDFHASSNEKQERRMRNRDRPDRGVWTPLRRSDGSHASDESLSSAISQPANLQSEFAEGRHGEMKSDMSSTKGGDVKSVGHSGHSLLDNGSHKNSGHRGMAYNINDADGSSINEGKPSRRGPSGYSSHEKQVWVQKSCSGS